MLRYLLFSLALLLVVSGCGDGSGNSKKRHIYSADVQKRGHFIDSGVEGMNYMRSKGTSGVTQKGGAFYYNYGDSITFSVGSMTLGSALAISVLTPRELVAYEAQDINVSIYDNRVMNRVRTLLSLDSDAKPGIQISSETRTRAKNWKTPDFSLSENNFTLAFNNATNGDISTLPSLQEATTHFETTLRCVYSGGYRGKWEMPNGERQGFVGVLIQADGNIVVLGDGQQIGELQNGVIYASGTHSVDTQSYTFTNSTFFFDPTVGRIVGTALTNVSGEGKSVGFDRIVGSFTQDEQKGVYSAFRIGNGQTTAYRYSGYGKDVNGGIIGIFTFDMNRDGSIVGMIHDARTNDEPELLGSVDFITGEMTIEVLSSLQTKLTGSVNFEQFDGNITLQWSDDNGTGLGTAQGIGCIIQEP